MTVATITSIRLRRQYRTPLGYLVYEYCGPTHGEVEEDTAICGEPFLAVTHNEDGSGPFSSMAASCLEELPCR